jgi:beta-xylosidase
MRRLLRSGRSRFLAGSVVLAVVTSGAAIAFGEVPASANTSGSITQWENSSDPELFQCPRVRSNGWTLCLMTSEDMGNQPVPYGTEKNHYPMNRTKLFRLIDDADASDPANWLYMGAPLTESALYGRGVPADAFHLWAPAARSIDGAFYPDVLDRSSKAAESTSSRIFAFKSTQAAGNGGYTFLGRIDTSPRFVNVPNTGYASDPHIALPYDGNRWLYYANGDNSNCGGISYAKLLTSDMSRLATPPAEAVFTGFENSGLEKGPACGGFDRPYIEGPAVYRWDEIGAPWEMPYWYIMVFAAKPGDGVIPPGCSTDNEVIAYAGANSIDGPWDYQGIIMCGSEGENGGEWTNQASITPHTANNGKTLIAWHDGSGTDGKHNRRTHLSCVVWGADLKIVRVPRSAWNLSNCP